MEQSILSGSLPQHSAEPYIALHPLELLDRLTALDTNATSAIERVRQDKDVLAESIHRSLRASYRSLLDDYAYFDPDSELRLPSEGRMYGHRPTVLGVIDQLDLLLDQARYRRLKPHEITQALRTASHWGLKLRVRFRDFQKLRVYSRGDSIERRTRRVWYLAFTRRALSVPVHRQMVVLYQPRHETTDRHEPLRLCLRMFKNVPHADMDMLLPGSVRMSLIDSGKIGIPTLWGFVMLASKLARNLWLLAVLGAMKVLTSMTFIAAVVLAGVFYSFKLFFSYRHAKNRHLLNVTKNLYYQTLSNNSGVLLRLMDEAEQQANCQALLLLFALQIGPESGQSEESLDAKCESLLTVLGLGNVNFDIRASLRWLMNLGLVASTDLGWRLVDRGVEPSMN